MWCFQSRFHKSGRLTSWYSRKRLGEHSVRRFGLVALVLASVLLCGTATARAGTALTASEFIESYLEERTRILTQHEGPRYYRKKGIGTPKELSPVEQIRINRYIPPSYFSDEGSSATLTRQRILPIVKYEIIDAGGPYVDIRPKRRKCRRSKEWINGCSIVRYKVGSLDGQLYLLPGKTLNKLSMYAPFWALFDNLNIYAPLTAEQKSEPIAEIRRNEAGRFPWLQQELDHFHSTVTRERLQSPSYIDNQIYCVLALFHEREIKLTQFESLFRPYLTEELMNKPDLLPGKLRILEQDNYFTNNLNPRHPRSATASLFQEVMFRVDSLAAIHKASSLEELYGIARKHRLRPVIERPLRNHQYFVIGHLLKYNDREPYTWFAEIVPRTHEYFSVAARLKFVNGVLTQNTMNPSWANNCTRD